VSGATASGHHRLRCCVSAGPPATAETVAGHGQPLPKRDRSGWCGI